MKPHVEFEMEDANGVRYPLEAPMRHLLGVSGLGMPPIKHWSTRAPFQTGETHWGYAVQPRLVSVGLLSQGCDRNGLWDRRKANVEMLNPMNGPLILRLTRPDRKTYELHDGWYVGGYELEQSDQDDPTVQMGMAQFKFHDPIWKWVNPPLDAGESRDANGRICVTTSTFTSQAELTIPFTPPFVLGVTVYQATLTCVNDGTWAVKPVITMTGPLEDWALENATTGKEMYWDGYSIAAGESVTIDIPNKTVANNSGTSLTAHLSGDYGTFALEPGSNTLNFWGADGVAAGTTVKVCWYVEVLGL